jgi:hypothetical protein
MVFVVLAILMVGAYFARRVHIHKTADEVEIQTPAGALRVNKGGHETGLPVYPGAVTSSAQNGNFEFNGADQNKVGLAVEHYRSPDPLEKVQEWYRNRLGSGFHEEHGRADDPDDSGIHIDINGRHHVAFVQNLNEGARTVALKRDGDGTQIDLVWAGKRQPI